MTDFLAGLFQRAAAFSAVEAALTRHCFQALLEGVPAPIAQLPSALGLPSADVERTVVGLAARGAIVVESGTVIVASGLSQPPTPHRLRWDGRTRHVCCAVDAVGIPAALGGAASVESRCQLCAAPVEVTIRGGLVKGTPASTVIWAADLDETRSVREFT